MSTWNLQNVTLSGDRVLEDVIKNRDEFILDQAGPQPRDKCPYERRKHQDTHEEDGHVKTQAGIGVTEPQTPRTAGATGSRKEQGRILPSSPQRECGPGDTLILDF